MAVPTEQFEASGVELTGALPFIFDGLYRRADGTWMFRFRIDGEADLRDGRRVRVSRHVALAATEQIGRKQRIGA